MVWIGHGRAWTDVQQKEFLIPVWVVDPQECTVRSAGKNIGTMDFLGQNVNIH
jgi:hypothetical protein